jgi:acyl-homoserine-lactone acylase
MLVAQALPGQTTYAPVNPANITIVRDSFGVPHIYGKTDAEASYGLAWAHAEDDFYTIQLNLLAAQGRLSEVKGEKGLLMDIAGQLIFADQTIKDQYDTTFSVEFKGIMDAYIQGLNKFAQTHPDEILLKNVFPITQHELIESYMVAMTLISGVGYDLRRIFSNTIHNQEETQYGSNAFALNSNKTLDDKTYLNINSHQPLAGNYSWYECHVNSEQGWNVLGGTFPGGICPFIGTNPNLGWAHTVNYPDMSDVYKLTMHPTRKLYYKFDGQWLKLEKHKARLKIKLGGIKIPVSKTFYKSVYGPTLKNKTGYYSMRFPANMSIKYPEQWFRMNKANNLDEFKKACAMQGIPVFNILYADKEDHIFMLSNSHSPYRNPNYNWNFKVLPGDTSATLWQANHYYPIDSLPQYTDPACGYLFNTNNTPFNATCKEENLQPDQFNATMGILSKDVSRSIRFQQLIEPYDQLSYADFKKIKSDIVFSFPLYTRNIENLDLIRHLDTLQYPKIKNEIKAMARWNGYATVENQEATVFSLAIQYILQYSNDHGVIDYNKPLPEKVFVDALLFAKKHLKKYFKGKLVPLGELQKLVRGKKELPLWGLPETICQMYTKPHKNGKLKGDLGESFIMLVQYDKNGPVIETINCYGSSNHAESPHYDDQMEMFVNQQYKPMTLNKDSIFKHAVKIYQPQ